jgi:hypothetical protein
MSNALFLVPFYKFLLSASTDGRKNSARLEDDWRKAVAAFYQATLKNEVKK